MGENDGSDWPAEAGVVEWYPAANVPAVIGRAGGNARKRFLEFFTATIRNENTRVAYARAVGAFFKWCRSYRLELLDIEPIHVAAYIERHPGSPPTVKQHPAAVRMLFDWLVVGQVLVMNPASSVRGPNASPFGVPVHRWQLLTISHPTLLRFGNTRGIESSC